MPIRSAHSLFGSGSLYMLRFLTPLFFLHIVLLVPATFAAQIEKIPYSRHLDEQTLTVVVSFDGSRDLTHWQEILDFARAETIPMTFYVSGVYFLADQEKDRYPYPLDPSQKGVSLIGFGGDDAMVSRRKALVLDALTAGHDIESHLNGHFDAGRWSQQVWQREFAAFAALADFLPQPARHVRFPLLAMNDKVYPVMAEFGVRSIASVADRQADHYRRVTIDYRGAPYTFLEFPIPAQQDGKSRFILMDYNIWQNDRLHKRTPLQAEEHTVALYLDEAERCLKERRPLFISHHFSPWNDGAYWNAAQRAIQLIKKEYPTRFVTMASLYEILEEGHTTAAEK